MLEPDAEVRHPRTTEGRAMSTNQRRRVRRALVTTAVAALAVAVSGGVATADRASAKYDPKIRPEDFGGPIDNPYFPLVPGTHWVYEADTPEGHEETVVDVTQDTKQIIGVDTVVVRDTVTLDGTVIEDTFDWYAQDRDGNVWYFGEDTTEFDNGVPGTTKGSFEAGVDGAQPGMVMLAHPKVGDRYRQEYSKGVAEDRARVLKVRGSATVPLGTFDNLVVTADLNPLEPGIVEHKYYAKGIGVVLEKGVKGSSERVELVEHTQA